MIANNQYDGERLRGFCSKVQNLSKAGNYQKLTIFCLFIMLYWRWNCSKKSMESKKRSLILWLRVILSTTKSKKSTRLPHTKKICWNRWRKRCCKQCCPTFPWSDRLNATHGWFATCLKRSDCLSERSTLRWAITSFTRNATNRSISMRLIKAIGSWYGSVNRPGQLLKRRGFALRVVSRRLASMGRRDAISWRIENRWCSCTVLIRGASLSGLGRWVGWADWYVWAVSINSNWMVVIRGQIIDLNADKMFCVECLMINEF